MPRSLALPSFALTPLSPEFVDEDFEAVTSSVDVLSGLLGNEWPQGLTKEENRIDLSWHEREFTLQRSFSWIVRDPTSNVYLGCAYLFPEQGRSGKAKVVTWIRQQSDRIVLLEKLNLELKVWLESKLDGRNYILEW